MKFDENMKLLFKFLLSVAVCTAKLTCFDKLRSELNKIEDYTSVENKPLEETIKVMLSSQINCKIGRSVRSSFYDKISECDSRKDMVEEAKANASRIEEKWCTLRGMFEYN